MPRTSLLLPGISQQHTTFLSDLRFFVQWFHGSISINLWLQRCAVSGLLKQALSCRAFFSLRSKPPFLVWLSCKICLEIVVHQIFAVFLNGLNGKNSSRSIVRNIFSVYFFYSGFKISYSEYSFVTQTVISGIRIVSYISFVLYTYLTCVIGSFFILRSECSIIPTSLCYCL